LSEFLLFPLSDIDPTPVEEVLTNYIKFSIQIQIPLSPEARIKQDQLHEITLQRIALLLDEGLKSKYVIVWLLD
jgi:hypothetical protein